MSHNGRRSAELERAAEQAWSNLTSTVESGGDLARTMSQPDTAYRTPMNAIDRYVARGMVRSGSRASSRKIAVASNPT